jgi:hypothetical protein
MSEATVRSATKTLFERYLRLIREGAPIDESSLPDEASSDHLTWMCVQSLENLYKWPEDKLSRWLGYVQGVLAVRYIIDIQEERDLSRPLFHSAYNNASAPVPPTLNKKATKRVVVFLDSLAYLLEGIRRTREGVVCSGLVANGGWTMSLRDNKVYVNDAGPKDPVGDFSFLQEVPVPEDHPGDYNGIIQWAREELARMSPCASSEN